MAARLAGFEPTTPGSASQCSKSAELQAQICCPLSGFGVTGAFGGAFAVIFVGAEGGICIQRVTADLKAEEKRQILVDNAVRVFNLD